MSLPGVSERSGEPTKWIECPISDSAKDNPHFHIRPLGKQALEHARDRAVDPKRPTRTERVDGFRVRKVPNIDSELLSQELMRYAVISWRGLRTKHLPDLIDPERFEVEPGEDQELPFSEETLAELIDKGALWFVNWISNESAGFSAAVEGQRAEQVSNFR